MNSVANWQFGTVAIKIFACHSLNVSVFRVHSFDVKSLFVVTALGRDLVIGGVIYRKNHNGERSFEHRMAPLTELITQRLRSVCGHREPKLAQRPSSPHSVDRSRKPIGGVLFCIVCSETRF